VLSDRLRPWSTSLADACVGVATPVALAGPPEPSVVPVPAVDLDADWILLVGPVATVVRPQLHALADRLGAPVANTWGAKGIYPWDDPHHMGTCGLQRDDLALLGVGADAHVLTVGTDPAETPLDTVPGASVVEAPWDRLDEIGAGAPARPVRTAGDNELYRRIAAIAQPGYVDDARPRHPARAVMDLKRSLGPNTRVTAQPGPAGLWVARTFPTDRMGSVVVPAVERPGIAAACALLSAANGTDTVCVVAREVDPNTAAARTVATRHGLPLRVEVWGDDVDWSRTDDLVAAAGPVVAWRT